MKTSKHMNLKTFFDPSQNHLLHKISLNLSSLSTLCTIIIIAYYKTIFYWFWSVCLAELRRSPPASIEELKHTVTEFANSLTPEEIKKAVGDIIPRAEACIMSNGGAFEYRLKKHKRGVEE